MTHSCPTRRSSDLPFAAYLRLSDFNTALFAHDALVFHALVLAAQAFIILERTEDARAEQTVAFGLERAVVNCFGLLDLSEGPGSYAPGGSTRAEAQPSELQVTNAPTVCRLLITQNN